MRKLGVYDYKRAMRYAEAKGYRIKLADVPNGMLYFSTPSGKTVNKSKDELINWAMVQKDNRA